MSGGHQKYSSRIYFSLIIILLLVSSINSSSSSCNVSTNIVEWKTFYDNVWNNSINLGSILYNNTSVKIYYYNMSEPFMLLESGIRCSVKIRVYKDKPYENPINIIEKYFNKTSKSVYSVWTLGGMLISGSKYLPYMQIMFIKSLDVLLKYLNIETGSQIIVPGGFLELIEGKSNTILIIDTLLSKTIDQKTNRTIEYLRALVILTNVNGVLSQSVYAEHFSRIAENITATTYYSHHIVISDKYLIIVMTRPIITARSFNPRTIAIIYSRDNISEDKIISLISDIVRENPFAQTTGNYAVGFNISSPMTIFNESNLRLIDNAYNLLEHVYRRFTSLYNNFSQMIYDETIKLIVVKHPFNNRIIDININWLYNLEKEVLSGNINSTIGFQKNSASTIRDYYYKTLIMLIIILLLIALFPTIAWRKLSRTI